MKLLIIEDSERLRKSLSTGFKALGFTVDCTGDGREGLNFALSYAYDAIILDIMLPSMDGISILKEVRDKRIQTNILILSAMNQLEDRVKGLNLGADDYLCKPFSFDELNARVLTLIRRYYQLKSNSIEIGAVSLDIQMKQISVNGTVLRLTSMEYSLVERLALNLNRVLSSEQLINHLFDSCVVTSKNAIEVHISSTRKKLKLAGVANFIQTHRGFGYVIRKPCSENL
tara:strand:- start:20176 stop:20862 length:687 start_codon:yes stop_codon:yes gene_type:complete